jgi:hypothetical protein
MICMHSRTPATWTGHITTSHPINSSNSKTDLPPKISLDNRSNPPTASDKNKNKNKNLYRIGPKIGAVGKHRSKNWRGFMRH